MHELNVSRKFIMKIFIIKINFSIHCAIPDRSSLTRYKNFDEFESEIEFYDNLSFATSYLNVR